MVSGLPWGLALSSGVNTYLPLFLLAVIARFGHVVHLSARFAWLGSDQAVVILGALAACEILAQKVPVLDNLWDFVHTLLRPLAGAVAAGATLNTNSAFEMAAAMLVGGTLAAAAHSTKSSVRLVSTSKSFGAANIFLSLGEDAAVLTTTLLSVYAPWVMLAVVVVFAAVFVWLGPRMLRTLAFDLDIAGSAIAGFFRWISGREQPRSLQESLLAVEPDRLAAFNRMCERGEELWGAVPGWKRARGGPRRTWLLLTSRRLYWIESRLFGSARAQAVEYSEIALARYRNLVLCTRAEFLTRGHLNFTLTVAHHHRRFAEWAVGKISPPAGWQTETPPPAPPLPQQLAELH